MNQAYRDRLELYSTELQQIWQTPAHSTILGLLGQWGQFHLMNLQNMPSDLPDFFNDPASKQNLALDFERFAAYGYHSWRIAEPLQLIGGLSFDQLRFPENFRAAPLSDDSKTVDRFRPRRV